MSNPDRISVKEIVAGIVLLALIGLGVYLSLGIFAGESTVKEVIIADASNIPDRIQVDIKLLTIDPIKGDATVRMDLHSFGNVDDDADGGLANDLKFYIPSANGKTEIEFKKGKVLTPVEAVLQLYDGNAADYPFDTHKAEFYAVMEKIEDKNVEKKPAEKPVVDEEEKPAAVKPMDDELPVIPLDVSFYGSIPGYSITATKGEKVVDGVVEGSLQIKRSSTVIAFSIFVAALMWGLSIAVLFLVMSVVLRGRKPELAMFSFMAALLFAYYAVRNSQPNVPPIGVFSDFVSFFWTEALVALCLLVTVFTWVFRTNK